MTDTIPDYTFIKEFASVLDNKIHNGYYTTPNNIPVNYNSTHIINDIESTTIANDYDEISLVRATGDAFTGGLAGRFLKGNVILYNKLNQRINQSISNIITAKLIFNNHDSTTFNQSDTSNIEECYVSVKLLNNGIFEISYIPHKSGLYKLHVLCNGKHIENSPFDIKILHGPTYGPNCYIEALEYDSSTKYNVNIISFQGLIIHAMDSENNRIDTGGDKFEITPLGNVKIVSTRDLLNGDYMITYYTSNLYPDEKCQLQVKLNGLEIKNSPFPLDHFVATTSKPINKSNEYQKLLQLKECLDNKKRIESEYTKLVEKIGQARDECNLAYVALNRKLIYNLPVNLKLDTLEKNKHDELMSEYVKKHAELSETAEKIDQDKQQLVELEKELIDTIRDKFKQLKEANRKYKLAHNIMEKELIRETITRKNKSKNNKNNSLDKYNDIRNNRTESYYNDNLGCVPGIYLPMRQNENTFKICETKPDNPTSPAFWFVEGRFLRKIAKK